MQALELKIPPVLQVAITALAMWGLSGAAPFFAFNVPGRHWLAVLFVGAGFSIALMGVLAFRRARTTVDPRVPSEASKLVIVGIYRWSRNPMYLGFLLALIGWAIFLSNALAFLPVPLFVLFMNRFQITPEEKSLREIFETEYETYCANVRRWI